MSRQFNLLKGANPSEEVLVCGDHKCHRPIAFMQPCFFDVDGTIYCDGCGKCLRYTRKKDEQRKSSSSD